MDTEFRNTVLIVEDDAFLVRVYEVKLKKAGARVWVAADGDKALAFLSRTPPSAVILDLMLSGTSGFDVLEAIRTSRHRPAIVYTWKKVPVFILTNLGQPQDIERGKELGATEYIIKTNTKIEALIDKIKTYFK